MRRINKNHDDHLHPLWLGILLLFSVITIIGMLCLLRRRYGLQILQLFIRCCCKNKSNNENQSKTNIQSPVPSAYSWTPMYNPPSSLSPKVYTLVRTTPMTSFDKEASMERVDSQEDEVFSIDDETDYVKTPSPKPKQNRDSETARRFYASMRDTSQCHNSSSVDSYNNEPPILSYNRIIRANRRDKLKFLRSSHFFKQ